jgi:hypothetical protein
MLWIFAKANLKGAMLQNLISFYFFDQELSLGTKHHLLRLRKKIDNFNPLNFRQV